jgi:hypothetical protein
MQIIPTAIYTSALLLEFIVKVTGVSMLICVLNLSGHFAGIGTSGFPRNQYTCNHIMLS